LILYYPIQFMVARRKIFNGPRPIVCHLHPPPTATTLLSMRYAAIYLRASASLAMLIVTSQTSTHIWWIWVAANPPDVCLLAGFAS